MCYIEDVVLMYKIMVEYKFKWVEDEFFLWLFFFIDIKNLMLRIVVS